MDAYSRLKPGEASQGPMFEANWQEPDSSKLPGQDEVLAYLDEAEERLAGFLVSADLGAEETQVQWTGATLLGRTAYSLRHAQHHLAEMCLELHCRGIKAPGWQ
jgi:hypothetical protein